MSKYNELEAGKRYSAFAPNGSEILGTYEMVPARAEIAYFMKGGEIAAEGSMDNGVDWEWQGGTELFWDGSQTQERVRKLGAIEKWVVYLANDGEEYTVDQLDFRAFDE